MNKQKDSNGFGKEFVYPAIKREIKSIPAGIAGGVLGAGLSAINGNATIGKALTGALTGSAISGAIAKNTLSQNDLSKLTNKNFDRKPTLSEKGIIAGAQVLDEVPFVGSLLSTGLTPEVIVASKKKLMNEKTANDKTKIDAALKTFNKIKDTPLPKIFNRDLPINKKILIGGALGGITGATQPQFEDVEGNKKGSKVTNIAIGTGIGAVLGGLKRKGGNIKMADINDYKEQIYKQAGFISGGIGFIGGGIAGGALGNKIGNGLANRRFKPTEAQQKLLDKNTELRSINGKKTREYYDLVDNMPTFSYETYNALREELDNPKFDDFTVNQIEDYVSDKYNNEVLNKQASPIKDFGMGIIKSMGTGAAIGGALGGWTVGKSIYDSRKRELTDADYVKERNNNLAKSISGYEKDIDTAKSPNALHALSNMDHNGIYSPSLLFKDSYDVACEGQAYYGDVVNEKLNDAGIDHKTLPWAQYKKIVADSVHSLQNDGDFELPDSLKIKTAYIDFHKEQILKEAAPIGAIAAGLKALAPKAISLLKSPAGKKIGTMTAKGAATGAVIGATAPVQKNPDGTNNGSRLKNMTGGAVGGGLLGGAVGGFQIAKPMMSGAVQKLRGATPTLNNGPINGNINPKILPSKIAGISESPYEKIAKSKLLVGAGIGAISGGLLGATKNTNSSDPEARARSIASGVVSGATLGGLSGKLSAKIGQKKEIFKPIAANNSPVGLNKLKSPSLRAKETLTQAKGISGADDFKLKPSETSAERVQKIKNKIRGVDSRDNFKLAETE